MERKVEQQERRWRDGGERFHWKVKVDLEEVVGSLVTGTKATTTTKMPIRGKDKTIESPAGSAGEEEIRRTNITGREHREERINRKHVLKLEWLEPVRVTKKKENGGHGCYTANQNEGQT